MRRAVANPFRQVSWLAGSSAYSGATAAVFHRLPYSPRFVIGAPERAACPDVSGRGHYRHGRADLSISAAPLAPRKVVIATSLILGTGFVGWLTWRAAFARYVLSNR